VLALLDNIPRLDALTTPAWSSGFFLGFACSTGLSNHAGAENKSENTCS